MAKTLSSWVKTSFSSVDIIKPLQLCHKIPLQRMKTPLTTKRLKPTGLSFMVLLSCIGMLLGACTPTQIVKTSYVEITKKPTTIQSTYKIPVVKPAAETQQLQTKGDVTVSVEVYPFAEVRTVEVKNSVVASSNPEFDQFEVCSIPKYDYAPKEITFKVRIKNGHSRILKLSEIALVILVNGVQASMADRKEIWPQANVIPGGELSFNLSGPLCASLGEESIIGIALYDVPSKYNQAGTVTKKENFEWFFNYSLITETKEDQIQYTYENKPVYKEKCTVCDGIGSIKATCNTCNGTGRIQTTKGPVAHSYCNGTGRVSRDCATCTDGAVPHRKSPDPEIAEQWIGYKIFVETRPAGIQILTFDPDKGMQVKTGVSNSTVDCWMRSTKMSSGQGYGIYLLRDGVMTTVLPFSSGKLITKVIVDFTTDPPTVVKGTLAQSKESPEQLDARKYLTLGWEAIEAGEYTRGIELCQKSLQFYEFGVAHFNIGYGQLKLEQDEAALASYQRGCVALENDTHRKAYVESAIKEIKSEFGDVPESENIRLILQLLTDNL